jgi:hypothetical protein
MAMGYAGDIFFTGGISRARQILMRVGKFRKFSRISKS